MVGLKREMGNDEADVLCCLDVEGYDSKALDTKTKGNKYLEAKPKEGFDWGEAPKRKRSLAVRRRK